jgi:hypothetical protein
VSPHVVIVHCTVPLTVSTPGWKRWAKKILGREESSDADNLKRNEYNTLVREKYGHEPLLDIAACESTLPDGSRSSYTVDGKTVNTLSDKYAQDSGHLNEAGRKVVAKEFVRVVAEALTTRKAVTKGL